MSEKKNKLTLFWQLQIAGWFLLFLIYLFLYYRNYWADSRTIGGLFLTYITGFLISLVLRKFYQKLKYKSRSIILISTSIIASSIIASNFWFWFDVLLTELIFGNVQTLVDLNTDRYLSNIWSHSIVLFLWSSFYFSIKLWDDWGTEKLRAEKANALAHAAQLQMLRYQLNPHFLFNSLNSIRALVEEDKNRAKSMITELSEFLRYSLLSKNFANVPLNNELEAIKHYLSIEKTRFEEKLIVQFNIDSNTEDYPVLSFLLHPIIENSIKYGMQTTMLPLRIDISAKLIDMTLVLKICNSGNWIDHNSNNSKSTGTGLENVKQRLENAFPEKHCFEIIKSKESVCIEIRISK